MSTEAVGSAGTPATAEQLVPLHRNRDFRRLWVGQAFSDLGTTASALAYPLLVLALTGSPVQAGLVGSANLATQTIFGLPAGALVDRWNRRRVMIACESVRALTAGTLVVAILTGWASLPVIVVLGVVGSAAGVFFGPAQSAALRHIVPTTQLPLASARNEARSYAAELAGPPLGGALFALARFAPFMADAISYLISLVAVASIRRPLQDERRGKPEGLARSIMMGLRFVVKEPFLRAVLGVAPIVNASFIGLIFVLVVVLRERGVPVAGIGGVQSAILAGGLVGALVAPWLQRRLRTPVLIIAALWLMVLLVGAAAVAPGTYTVAALLAIAILPSPTINAGLFGYQIAITPDAMQGRVDGAISLFATSLGPFAPLLAGVLVELWGGQWAFAAFATFLAVAAVIASVSRGIRTMRPLDRDADQAVDSPGQLRSAIDGKS
ncbi:MFS transporter [Actinopolymorpha alba]|uniref:MFS transporter n=1 Tax=Actinopolymorpha alba TaxID=533267 RepID=UPI00037DCF8A|nr:MFS transporter [Actinopolymorpha alba]